MFSRAFPLPLSACLSLSDSCFPTLAIDDFCSPWPWFVTDHTGHPAVHEKSTNWLSGTYTCNCKNDLIEIYHTE